MSKSTANTATILTTTLLLVIGVSSVAAEDPKAKVKQEPAAKWQDVFDRETRRLAKSISPYKGPVEVVTRRLNPENGGQEIEVRAEFEKRLLHNPNPSLFVGDIVTPDSVASGLLTSVFPNGEQRGKLTLTSDLTGGKARVIVENPDSGSVREATNKLVNDYLAAKGKQPAQLFYAMTEAFTVDQAMLALQADVGWMTGAVKAGFQSQIDRHKYSLMVQFSQVYYTLSVVPPAKPSDWVSDGEAALNSLDGEKSPLAYVSSVNVGRSLWLLASSNGSLKSLQAYLNANNSFLTSSADIQAAFNQLLSDEGFAFTTLVLGGNSTGAAELLTSEIKPVKTETKPEPPKKDSPVPMGGPGSKAGAGKAPAPVASSNPTFDVSITRKTTIERSDLRDKLSKFLTGGSEFSNETPGVPLSYSLSYLGSNRVARISAVRTAKVTNNRKVIAFLLDYSLHGDHGKDGEFHIWERPLLEKAAPAKVVKGVDLIATVRRGGDEIAQQGLSTADAYTAWVPRVKAPTQRIELDTLLTEQELDNCTIQIGHRAINKFVNFETAFKIKVRAVFADDKNSGKDSVLRAVCVDFDDPSKSEEWNQPTQSLFLDAKKQDTIPIQFRLR
jgi:hypothetical protein